MTPDRSKVDEAVRAEAMRGSDLVARSIAWARCDALRSKNVGNAALKRLLALIQLALPGHEIVDTPGDHRLEGNLIITELPVLKYSIDIAIPSVGIAIEHDEANNHSSVRNRAKDAIRAGEISEAGWAVLSIHHLDWVFCDDPLGRVVRLISESKRGIVVAGIQKPLKDHPCACGCGSFAKARNRYVHGHHLTSDLAKKAAKARGVRRGS